MRSALNHSSGLSMLEIVIAAAIVAIAFIPLLSTLQYGNKATVKINNFGKAAKLAQGLIEECKHIPFSLYKQDYLALGKDEWFDVNPLYYPKTTDSIAAFKTELKSLKWDADLKIVKDGEQIREVWIKVHASWEEGDGTTKLKPRELRLANAIRNTDVD